MYHLQELNMINNKRALFEVRSPIKVPSTPRPGIGQSLILTGSSSGLHSLPEAGQFKTVLISCSLQLSDHVIACLSGAHCRYEAIIVLVESFADWFICDSKNN